MAKLTLTFKGKPIRAYQFETGDRICIGRNVENEIHIDSLAVAPVHAEIKIGDQVSTIQKKENDLEVRINDNPINQHELRHGDLISIGKHVLYFTEDSTFLEMPNEQTGPKPDVVRLDDRLDEELKQSAIAEGQLQILNGKNIGRVIMLKRGLTRLGKEETGIAVIAKRKDGYYVASLKPGAPIKLNGALIDDTSYKLEETDILEIDRTEMQFFLSQAEVALDDI